MHHSTKVEKIKSPKRFAWNEDQQPRRGDKRNKPARNNDKRFYQDIE